MDKWIKSKILETLQRHHVMTLATIRPDGYPQATTVNYVHDDLTLFFATDAASQKAGNIKLNNKVSIAIASEAKDLYKLRGLSMSGTAERVCDTKRAQELSLLLFTKLPQAKRLVPEDPNSSRFSRLPPWPFLWSIMRRAMAKPFWSSCNSVAAPAWAHDNSDIDGTQASDIQKTHSGWAARNSYDMMPPY